MPRRFRYEGHVARVGNVYEILFEIPDRRIQAGRPRGIWKSNIKMHLSEIRG